MLSNTIFLSLLLLFFIKREETLAYEFARGGVAREIQGLWVGDEKYYLDELYSYCSRYIFNPPGSPGRRILLWESIFTTCEEAGIDALTGEISGDYFGTILMDGFYVEKVKGWECIPEDECDDVFSNPDDGDSLTFEGWTVEAKSCGRNVKKDISRETFFFCDAWQTAILSRKMGDQTETIVVNTATYGKPTAPGEPYSCPLKPTFRLDELIADPEAEGTIQGVLRQSFPDAPLTDVCEWDCYEPPKGMCD